MKFILKHKATLLETVMEVYKGTSKQKAKQIIRYSEFLLNGEKIENHPNKILEAESLLEIKRIEKSISKVKIPDRRNPVVIYFEDSYLIVALKPAGILSCGNRDLVVNNSYHKLLEEFLYGRDNRKIKLWVVHRLDREVEGLLLFAKSEKVQQLMKKQWPMVIKKYLALTENKPEQLSGTVENWLKDTSNQKVVVCGKEVPGSKYTRTDYRYVKSEKPYHLLEIRLYTGRKNQIRVHLAGINCPIVGDRKYGADDSIVRQIRLSAFRLEFEHPVTKRIVLIQYKPSKRFFMPSAAKDEKYKII
jgi:23S rRNA pseudouridine1911/1915/1917 synthase